MINIFRATDTVGEKRGRYAKMISPSAYITERMMAVSEGTPDDWSDEISYMEMLYYRVLEDPGIDEADRGLDDMLDKLDEDLQYSMDIFGERADNVLTFLESDTMRHALNRSSNEAECRILGHIRYIRNERFGKKQESNKGKGRTPAQIKEYLDAYIIGQDDAKIALSNAVYGHMKRIRHPDVKFAPDVVLMIGPSGCGKTELMRRIANISDEPMICTDVSNLGAGQYRGRHKEDILMDLYMAAGKDLRKAERGIIFMDEFDKLLLPAVSERGVNVHDDVQSQLLTMLEGSDVELKTDGQSLVINTSRILFVLAGAFQGIDEFIRKDRMKRENSSAGMGFLSTLKQDVNTEFIRENINHDVLMEYGMKTELAGRISSIAVLEKLGREELLRILTEADDGMPQCYAKEVELGSRAKLIFREDALEAIADEALESGVGARALRSILSRVMLPVLYKAPAMKGLTRVVISRECVTDGVDAEYVLGEDDTPLSELIRESREDER